MASDSLLPFQQDILQDLSQQDGLLVLAPGLGLRTIISTFLRAHSQSACPELTLLINATPDDEAAINDQLGMRMACIAHELGSRERERIYKDGGVLSITSRILIVDMLNSKIDLAQITGIVILHAEEVNPTSVEAFILRVFRNANKNGFVKAFSEDPEHFTYGLCPLQTVLGQLKLRNVFLWPRFRAEVKRDLGAKKQNDVIELQLPLSPSMSEIQTAIIESMDATLGEIRRSNTNLEVDDLTVDNALFRSFDTIIRTQLNPIWHRVSPKTRQLVSDLTTLRKLLSYLLSFDCIMFYRFLETILVANSSNDMSPGLRQAQSPWLFTTAADTIYSVAKSRVYVKTPETNVSVASNGIPSWVQGPTEDEEEAMREMEVLNAAESAGLDVSGFARPANEWTWLPKHTQPVLENQPKWELLQEVLKEIEENIWQDDVEQDPMDTNAVLIMCSSTSTCSVLKEFLVTQHDPLDSKFSTRSMMKRRLRDYFFWKGTIGKMTRNFGKPSVPTLNKPTGEENAMSAALKRKVEVQRKSGFLNKRRRVRGAGAGGSGTGRPTDQQTVGKPNDPDALEKEATEVADMLDSMTSARTIEAKDSAKASSSKEFLVEEFDEDQFAAYFDLLSMDDLIVIRQYLGDEDDRVLEELRPRHIIMYEPDLGFIRRVECYRTRNPGLHVKPYFLMYSDSVEEQKYLSSIRREKEAFERLIRENSSMVIPLDVEARPGESREEELVHTISSRLAGGKLLQTGMPKVIVDVREFRSSLPSLLHAAKFTVEPTTLMVGDYILSPEMCVERKSIADLIQSFNSGRLYQQCEMMSAHYKQPILLIEFDEKKSFTLETYKDARGTSTSITSAPSDTDLQAKLVLLTLSFRKLRLIWSSSPYTTAEIFRELKLTHAEPDAEVAGLVGLDDAAKGERGRIDLLAGSGTGLLAQEMLKALPGMDELKARKLVSAGAKGEPAPRNISELCQLSERDLKNWLGPESGSRLHRFLHDEVDHK